jgi:hypothetical protein
MWKCECNGSISYFRDLLLLLNTLFPELSIGCVLDTSMPIGGKNIGTMLFRKGFGSVLKLTAGCYLITIELNWHN